MSYPIIPVFIPHIGCPHDCVFCNQKRIAGTKNAPKPEEVSAHIASALEIIGHAEVAFYGGSFTAIDKELQREYLTAAKENSGVCAVRVSTRPDAIDAEILELLKEYGVTTVELGAQSMDNNVLDISHRGHTKEDIVRASHMIKEAGFNLILQMMVGLPGDSYKGAIDTAREIASLAPNGVRVYPTVVVRDTMLEDLWRAGEYRAMEIDEAVEVCADIVQIFEAANIPIIRMGLNPTEDLSGGDALAGVYHPAFGQLVSARRRLKMLCDLLYDNDSEEITIYVHPSEVSDTAGHKGENKKILLREFNLKKIRILPDGTLARGQVKINK